jgi:outer membrane protein assembly factor BamD
MKRHLFPFSLCFLYLFLACGPAPPVSTPDAEDQYQLAMERFEDEKYEQAQLEYQKLIWNYPGSDLVDDAQYHLAECHRLLEDYPTAVVEYSRLVRSYSQSPFAPTAHYKLALCYYQQSLPSHLDQDFTHMAIHELNTFLEEHPGHEDAPEARKLLLEARTKLAKKEYENARLYYKMDAYDSAIIYIEELLEEYPDTKWAPDAHYLIGECYREQGNRDDALAAYRQVLELDASGKAARQAEKRIRQIEEK